MARMFEAPGDIQDYVANAAESTGLLQMGVDFMAISTERGKDVIKVVKANDFAEIASNREDLVFVVIRQDVFDAVDDENRKLWLEMALSTVHYDDEKQKVVIGEPTITVPVGFYEKYKSKAVDSALLQQYTLAQIEDRKKEERKAKREAKKNKK